MAAKQAHQKKLSTQQGGIVIEQHSVYDDSLLPPADELAKLKAINPAIVDWIMERTTFEQEERLKIAKFEFRGQRRYNISSLIFAFAVIIAGLSFSTFLVFHSMNIMGTVFAGGTLIMAANAFIRASRKNSINL